MTEIGFAAPAFGEIVDWDNDPQFVSPWEFVEERVPELWPNNGIDRDVCHLEAAPGPGLAAVLGDTDPAALDGDGLLTAIGAWRRLTSWAKAGELAAVAAFLDKRTGDRPGSEAVAPHHQHLIGLVEDQGNGDALKAHNVILEAPAVRRFDVDQGQPDPRVVIDRTFAEDLGPQLFRTLRSAHPQDGTGLSYMSRGRHHLAHGALCTVQDGRYSGRIGAL